MKGLTVNVFFAICAAIALTLSLASFSTPKGKAKREHTCKELHQNMRKLWSDHAIWTRQYIVSTLANLPDASSAATRLLKNQEDIGNSIAPYFGDKAAAQLTNLLKQHILIATDVVKAAMNSDRKALRDADQKWHDNAKDIARFLSSANPNWSKSKWEDMLNMHLTLTTNEVTYRLQQKWSEDVNNFDQILDQALSMADALSSGIAKQFMLHCKDQ